MIDYGRIFHTGFLVTDLEATMATYAAIGVRWATPAKLRGRPFWTPSKGIEYLDLDVTYSIDGPQHIEIQCGTPGSFYDPRLHSGFHAGLWVDDVAAETSALIAKGWSVAIAGEPPEQGYGIFAYLTPPDGGMMIELVSPRFRPMLEAWLAGDGSLG